MKNKIILQSENWTVISDIKDIQKKKNKISPLSEYELEKEFIKNLQSIGYEYLQINKEEDLINNLRIQIEKLNNIKFNDNEWSRFYKQNIKNKETVEEATEIFQENQGFNFIFDNGESNNIWLIKKYDIFKNSLQVINQFEVEKDNIKSRYDVTILVNGLPLVHIELKRSGINLKNAFNQIERYMNTSFNNLFNFVQIFVISNGARTKYYSNTTRQNSISSKNSNQNSSKKISNSYEFTSYWTDQKNERISDLEDFTMSFFMKRTILNILTKYCVFDINKDLKVMRPYQIIATEKILERINVVVNNKMQGKEQSGGYIWHTTGSGKTLTSFKVATLASEMDEIKKVLFVVDRKDLDYQTIKEFNKFQKDAVNSTKNTSELRAQLNQNNINNKIAVTTIQKLSNLVNDKKNNLDIFKENIVLIFDECHRSQFGKMRNDIAKKFKNHIMFGFTGTPISAKNANLSNGSKFQTTEQIFGKELHQYTIVDAIHDNNVLKFKIDYMKTIKNKEIINLEKGTNVDENKVYLDPKRISKVTKYILDWFDVKTKRSSSYWGKVETDNKGSDNKYIDKRMSGFNSIFAVSSIQAARLYYEEFRKQQKNKQDNEKLKVGMIYSFDPNEGQMDEQGNIVDNDIENNRLDASSREALENAIQDYNAMFGGLSFSLSNGFDQYYKDISLKTKNKELDILIVVNMFLTGFDAPQLNTLWVDKKLRYHGLLQAFSRTNRILNSVKSFGQIVTFRTIEKEVNDSLELFSNKNARGIIILKTYEDYIEGYHDENGKYKPGFIDLVESLKKQFPFSENGRLTEIVGEKSEKEFIILFGKLQKILNILSSFDEFHEMTNKNITEYEIRKYQSLYLDIWDKLKKEDDSSNKIIINDSLDFEIELVKQVEINIDFILQLIAKYSGQNNDRKIKDEIMLNIDSSISLRDKKDLIIEFMEKQEYNQDNVYEKWDSFKGEKKEKEIEDIVSELNLDKTKTNKLIDSYIKKGEVQEYGQEISEIFLEKHSYFNESGLAKINRARKSFFKWARNFLKKFIYD
ncbi:MAG: type I restriction endonuclease subunit R [Metamycoplasmataceae bacterium]